MINPGRLTKPRLLIIGSGFAGLYSLWYLKKQGGWPDFDISLITSVNYFLFTPLLHEVAAGSLSAGNVVEPLRNKFPANIKIILDEVKTVNLDSRQVVTKAGRSLVYDYLVVAPGTRTNWFKVSGALENSWPLKTLAEALAIKNQLIANLEQATNLWEDSQQQLKLEKLLTWVIVGGGPTGVEMAAELSHLVKGTVVKLYPALAAKIKIILVQRGSELLKEFSPRFGQQARQKLTAQGVSIKFNSEVTLVNQVGLQLKSGEFINSQLVIWLAGVKPVAIAWQGDLDMVNNGRIKIQSNLQLFNYSNVYVLGDSAALLDKETNKLLPQLAQVAVGQAKITAHNLWAERKNKPLKEFVYKSKGNLVSLGQWLALAEIGNWFFEGPVAWWLWRTVYLSKLLSGRKKIQVAWEWTWNIFFPRNLYKP
ncbi:NAD(P)/FAD-dependent oxidoreductase [Patescibacteria group bacterium]|nr:NAD(P)/FAD-dependent oxidoreductase [Patescibacteria group bacterium]